MAMNTSPKYIELGPEDRIMAKKKIEPSFAEIRKAVADYVGSEGCNCCSGSDHEEHKDHLGELLDIPKYSDGSGYDFYKVAKGKK